MKKIIALVIVVLIAIALFLYSHRTPEKEVSLYQPVEGSIELTEAQKKDLPETSSPGIRIERYRDQSKIWQVFFGPNTHQATQETAPRLILGELDQKPSAEVGVPVYSCSFPLMSIMNKTLDTDLHCSGEGKLEKAEPVGYLSKEIRVGFRMLVRCRSKSSGLYLSLNSHCESPDDRVDALLGSIRAELNEK